MNKLQVIADLMRREAEIRRIARHPLKGGLHLTLRLDDDHWILSLSHQGTEPSDDEEKICRRDFGIPDEAERETSQSKDWQIVRLKWSRRPSEQLSFAPSRQEQPNHYRAGL